MKKIHKLVLKTYLGPMFLTFFIVTFILLMNFLWRYLDELVGKGLSLDVIFELLGYAIITSIPMGLPLATLLAAIMTMGNLGENYELLAMKSAGMSLPQIMKPLFFVVGIIAVSSFFVSNNLVPYATEKMFSMIQDVRKQKQSIEFKDGAFFNGMSDEGISIRVGHQDPNTMLLTDILIYNNSDGTGRMTTTMAKSGYIRLSEDKNFLVVTLYDGINYDQGRTHLWYDKATLDRHFFKYQNQMISMAGFNFGGSGDGSSFNPQTKNIVELELGIDSLRKVANSATKQSYEPLLTQYIFTYDWGAIVDSLKIDTVRTRLVLADSIQKLNIYEKKDLWARALGLSMSSQGLFSFDEDNSKEALSMLYKYQVEWHRKVSLPVSIIIFFLIGAPLGAIIRRGGLGMPTVVSIVFFVLYYMVSLTGEKMTREGNWSAITGMWYATFILLPIAIFLTYKATNDSNLFDVDWYMVRINKVRDYVKKLFNKR